MAAPTGAAARRRKRGGGDDTNRWLGTYGDAVTLLMAFFVMLYAMSQVDQLKFEAFVSGLAVPFANPAIEQGLLSDSSALVGDSSTDGPVQPAQPEPVRVDLPLGLPPRPAEALADDSDGMPESPDESPEPSQQPSPIDIAQLERVRDEVKAALGQTGLAHVAKYHMNERGLVVSIAADDILFESGSTTIGTLGRQVIAAVAAPLRRYPNDVLVEGHTDDVPLRRRGYSNWNLSTDRAVAVLSLLADEHALPPQRLGAVGYGQFRPQVANSSPANRSRNRRVDILVIAQGV